MKHMKRIFILVFLIILCFSLTGCLKSDEAKSVDVLIVSLGTVTLESEDAILKIENAYEELPNWQKKKVEYYEVLVNARDKYNDLLQEYIDTEISPVETLISKIGTVSDASGRKIKKARAAYDKLDPDLKKHVKGADTLFDAQISWVELCINNIGAVTIDSERAIALARTTYDELQKELKTSVKNVDTLISAEKMLLDAKVDNIEACIQQIGTVTLEKEDLIKDARSVYEEGDKSIKELVSNYQLLLDAEAKLSTLKVNNVIDLITKIGEVTLEEGENIRLAKLAYTELSKDERKLVSNHDKLEKANEAYNALKQEADEIAAIEKARSIIRVTKVAVSPPDTAGGVELYFNYINNSEKTIKYVDFGVTFYNAVGDIVKCRYKNSTVNWCRDTGPHATGQGHAGTWGYWGDFYNSTIKTAKLVSLEIIYMDETRIQLSQKQIEAVQY